METYSTLGRHIVVDMFKIQTKVYLDSPFLLKLLAKQAIKLSGAELLDINTFKFEPQGVTLTAIISESSMDIHTYPEHGDVFISFYTCGSKADPLKGIQFIKDVLKPTFCKLKEIERGNANTPELETFERTLNQHPIDRYA